MSAYVKECPLPSNLNRKSPYPAEVLEAFANKDLRTNEGDEYYLCPERLFKMQVMPNGKVQRSYYEYLPNPRKPDNIFYPKAKMELSPTALGYRPTYLSINLESFSLYSSGERVFDEELMNVGFSDDGSVNSVDFKYITYREIRGNTRIKYREGELTFVMMERAVGNGRLLQPFHASLEREGIEKLRDEGRVSVSDAEASLSRGEWELVNGSVSVTDPNMPMYRGKLVLPWGLDFVELREKLWDPELLADPLGAPHELDEKWSSRSPLILAGIKQDFDRVDIIRREPGTGTIS